MKQVIIKNGNIYLSHDLCETYFKRIESVALLIRNESVLLLPVQQAGGGLLLKIRNANGDRVIHASEFFMQHKIKTDAEMTLPAIWDADSGALVFSIGRNDL